MNNIKNLSLVFLLSVGFSVSAQTGPPPPLPPSGGTSGPGLPIDSGVLILLALGLALGSFVVVKAIKKRNA